MIACGGTFVGAAEPASALPRSSPEAQGIPSSAILAFVEAADRNIDAMHSVMLLRHGHVVAAGWWSPYDAGTPHSLYSLSKSFTSTAVGLAVAEGKLSVDDEVLKFFPDDAPAAPSEQPQVDARQRPAADVHGAPGRAVSPGPRRTGPRPSWRSRCRTSREPISCTTRAGTYMLSAIVQKATGMTVLDYLRPRLFEPLGIENPTWGTSPQGVIARRIRVEHPHRGHRPVRPALLAKGEWHGKQLVPAAWVAPATPQTANGSNPKSDWDQGYGYQFWRCRHGAYRGDGAFGQFCVVMPEQDAVVAITSGAKDMQSVLNLVWEHLLPAMKPRPWPRMTMPGRSWNTGWPASRYVPRRARPRRKRPRA